MDWSNETYVRLYVADTAAWKAFIWQAKAVLPLLFRKCERSGLVAVKPGPNRLRLISGLIELPLDVVAPGMADLLVDGCMVEVEAGYLFPNFIAAQEAPRSDPQRAKESRLRRRAESIAKPAVRDDPSQNVTQPSQNEANRHSTLRHSTLRYATPRYATPEETTTLSPGGDAPVVSGQLAKVPTEDARRGPQHLVLVPQTISKPSSVEQVFEHWRKVTGKVRAKLDSKRRAVIDARLKAYSVQQLIRAIDGYGSSSWHAGQNRFNRPYQSLGLWLRDADHVEAGWELPSKGPAPPAERHCQACGGAARTSQVFGHWLCEVHASECVRASQNESGPIPEEWLKANIRS